MDEIKIFIGIDQTGAVNHKGKPKPLNVSVIDLRKKPQYFTGLQIAGLNLETIQQLLAKNIFPIEKEKILICVDSVFGLPEVLKIKPKKVFQTAKKFSFKDKHYGAETAFEFFRQFLTTEQIPERTVEKLVKANSVFNLKPYQKNIGCGSFRVIKDLAQDSDWFSLWPFDKMEKQYIIAEGYPSYFWRSKLNCKTRDLLFLSKKFKKLQFSNLDQADSFVLAYGASQSLQNLLNIKLNNKTRLEGWILGVTDDSNS